MNSFYLTLPSNDGSKKYFPSNTHHSWKNQLKSRIDSHGTWKVGLASITLPYALSLKNRWEPFLRGLSDNQVLLTTSRLVVNSQRTFKKVTFFITYGEVKKHTLLTPFDILEAHFQEEHIKFVYSLDDTWRSHLPNDKSL